MGNWPDPQSIEEQILDNEYALASEVHLQRKAGELRATYRWLSWKRLLMYLPGTILLLFFGGIFIWGGITSPLNLELCLISMIMGGGMLMVGLWGLGHIMAVLANRTMIEIASGQLAVRHGPLFHSDHYSVPCSELEEIRVEGTSERGVPIFAASEATGGALWLPKVAFFRLCAVRKDGRKFELAYGPDQYTIGYLRMAITRHLGLKDSSATTNMQSIAAPSLVLGSAKETRADTMTRKIEVYKRFSDSESTVPVIEMQNPDGTSILVVGAPEGELVPFQCPWCGQTFQTAVSGDNVFFDCSNCKNRTLLTRS